MSQNPSSSRDYSIDNIRFILIFSVVFAHLLEICTPSLSDGLIYKFIYSFHMPAFIFLFGYNVKFSPKKIMYHWCIPYIIFQCIYISFSNFFLNFNDEIQFTTPYWFLWYMLVCIYYQLILPLFDTNNKSKQIIVITCAFIVSLLVGFEKSIGYYMSLSRFFVFLPWFLLGYYCKNNNLIEHLSGNNKKRFFIFLISAAVIYTIFPFIEVVAKSVLYCSCSYESCKGTFWMRGLVSIMSFSMILFLFICIRPYLNRKLFLITNIGQNTWPIFLLHGFIIKIIPIYFPYLVNSLWSVILLSCAIVIFIGNKFCNKIIYYVCFSWLEKLFKQNNT